MSDDLLMDAMRYRWIRQFHIRQHRKYDESIPSDISPAWSEDWKRMRMDAEDDDLETALRIMAAAKKNNPSRYDKAIDKEMKECFFVEAEKKRRSKD